MIEQTGALLIPPDPNDFIAGEGGIDIADRVLDNNWSKYKVKGEKQHEAKFEFDSMSCVSFAANNCIEMQLNYLLRNNLLPSDAKEFLYNHGYIVDNEVNLSDKYLAIKSKTTKKGNGFGFVANTLHNVGAIPESMLPFGGNSWEEYHDPSQITEEMDKLATEFLLHFNIKKYLIFYLITLKK